VSANSSNVAAGYFDISARSVMSSANTCARSRTSHQHVLHASPYCYDVSTAYTYITTRSVASSSDTSTSNGSRCAWQTITNSSDIATGDCYISAMSIIPTANACAVTYDRAI
jgi:hypothetical protein